MGRGGGGGGIARSGLNCVDGRTRSTLPDTSVAVYRPRTDPTLAPLRPAPDYCPSKPVSIDPKPWSAIMHHEVNGLAGERAVEGRYTAPSPVTEPGLSEARGSGGGAD